MESKKHIFLLLIICCFIFVSCNEYERNEINNEAVKLQTNNTEIAEKDIHKDINENTYTLVINTYSKGKINIKYPQINQLQNNDIQQDINEIVKKQALKLVGEVEKDEIVTTLDIDYNIKRFDDKLLSIQFIGYINSKGAPYPMFLAYTSNINIESGTELKLIDYFDISKDFVKQYRKGKLNVLKSFQNEAFEGLSDEEILTMFKSSELYLTEDSLGLTVFVPHAVGDFAELEIKYNDLKDIIEDDMKWESIIK